jgi:hypothetical protein
MRVPQDRCGDVLKCSKTITIPEAHFKNIHLLSTKNTTEPKCYRELQHNQDVC